jgi:hypothetical protein
MLRRGHSFSGHEVQVDKVIEEAGIEGDIDFKKFCYIMGVSPPEE